jgi:hypothetical protein
MTKPWAWMLFGAILAAAWPAAAAPDVPEGASEPQTHLLRYRFEPGETLRWEVEHRTRMRSSVSGTTQTAETTSRSTKLWRVTGVAEGAATFEHVVEDVDMRQKLTGREEVRYRSAVDEEPPPGFGDVAEAVGVPLSVITLDARGKVLHRERRPLRAAAQGSGDVVIPLPEEPVAVGGQWSLPNDVDVPLQTGGILKVKAVQRFTLEDVKTGVATIRVVTRILTPIQNPAVLAQVAPYETTGVVRFDVDAGRILSQRMDVDKQVVGFRGGASSLHYMTRFSEEFLSEAPRTAAR